MKAPAKEPTVEEWQPGRRVAITNSPRSSGKTVVFTGALTKMTRDEAGARAEALGAKRRELGLRRRPTTSSARRRRRAPRPPGAPGALASPCCGRAGRMAELIGDRRELGAGPQSPNSIAIVSCALASGSVAWLYIVNYASESPPDPHPWFRGWPVSQRFLQWRNYLSHRYLACWPARRANWLARVAGDKAGHVDNHWRSHRILDKLPASPC